jgi:predicted GIY-YIG superfamily endonuclease
MDSLNDTTSIDWSIYETFTQVGNAIAREKQIKSWTRAKRIALIKSKNPAWRDLAEGWGERFELQIPRSG